MGERYGRLPLAGLTLGVALLSGCASVPETGRSQVLLVSPQEEIRLGMSAFQEAKASLPRARDPAQNALLQRVGRRIASVVELPGAQWEFVLFENPRTPNAFCLPGGKVGVYTGILPITQDADGLATVIGHEVAHAVARHGAERMSEALLIELGGQVLAVALGARGALTRQVALQAYGIGAEVGRALPHSRSQELEADQLGLLYMARAGYDPRKAVAFWRRFQAYNQERGGSRVEFLSTHPLDDRRIAQIEAYLPQALRAYRGAEGSEP